VNVVTQTDVPGLGLRHRRGATSAGSARPVLLTGIPLLSLSVSITPEEFEGQPNITLANADDSEARVILGIITKDGLPFLAMYDAKKKRRQIAVEPSGPKVRLIDAEGHPLTAPPR
jgi:hypothetical protein